MFGRHHMVSEWVLASKIFQELKLWALAGARGVQHFSEEWCMVLGVSLLLHWLVLRVAWIFLVHLPLPSIKPWYAICIPLKKTVHLFYQSEGTWHKVINTKCS